VEKVGMTQTRLWLDPAHSPDAAAVMVDVEYMTRCKVEPGGYLVEYEGGYQSFSPAKAFEDGYAEVDAGTAPTVTGKTDSDGLANMPNPTEADLATPAFNAIWEATKSWDVNVPAYYKGYCGMNGSHVMLILNELRAASVTFNAAAPTRFGSALLALEEGKKVARAGWNGKGMWLLMQKPDAHSKMSLPYIYIEYPEGHPAYPKGSRVPWLPSQTDMLACDWCVVE
jgi:hypothetical protein